ncbi:hypothetical protein [Levilactobacillus enshiensis]|uniref:hypothetical protein n=1 Tax=Levilactobacillus enshiensis TaxID=2590213 RepID=UPI0011798E31|nr:hypothetical protein [Levilactobacillus enshiensis]
MVNQQFDLNEQSKQDKQRANDVKSELLERYRQLEQQRPALVLTNSAEHPTTNDPLKSELRRLRRQVKHDRIRNQVAELREKLRIAQQSQRHLKKENQALREENQTLHRKNIDITQRYQAKQLDAAMTQRQINYVQAYFAQAGFLLQAAENRLETARRLQHSAPPLQKIHNQRKQLRKLTLTKKQLLVAQKRERALKVKVTRLKQELTASHATVDKLTQKLSLLRSDAPQYLEAGLKAFLTPENFQQVPWLPDFAKRYRQLRLDNLIIRHEKQTYGYFVKVNDHLAFKTIDDQILANYHLNQLAEPRLDVIYAGVLTGNQSILLTQTYAEVTPHDLHRDKLRRLHQRAQPRHFTNWLPADGKAILTGKRILIVTWQQTQTLNQALRFFGVTPVIVNNREKSIPWIIQQATGQRTDLTFLMSEGLSHAVLETLTKSQLHSRPNIHLVYRQSPADIVNQAYQHFKTQERPEVT